MQKAGHYGPYAAVLHSDIYADTHAPLEKTLIMPADRIKALMMTPNGFFGAGTLPTRKGFVVSVGGNSMDVAVGMYPITAFIQVTAGDSPGMAFQRLGGRYQFRVYERFVLRLKDPTAVVVLKFKEFKAPAVPN